jgi:hypothetical protein
MQRFLDNPFIGEGWLPLAEVLIELHKSKPTRDLRLSTITSLYPKLDQKRGAPRIRIQFMDTGEAILVASANSRLSRQLKQFHYQYMDFLGYTIPRTESGEFAITERPYLSGVNENFIRVFDEGYNIEDIVESAIMLLVLLYKVPRRTMFFFGSNDSQHVVVHRQNKLARLAPWSGNEKASVFTFKDQVRGQALFEEEAGRLDANQ